MFTAIKLGDTIDKQTQRRIITVKFTDGVSEFNKDFQFKIDETVTNIKKAVGAYLNEINFVPETIPNGTLDTSIPAEVTPTKTQAEIDKENWQTDRETLRQTMELVRDGVFTGAETAIVNLQAKVKAGFKQSYLN